MNKEVVKGFFVGVIAPIAAFVVYVAFFTEDAEPKGMYKKLVEIGKLSPWQTFFRTSPKCCCPTK